MCALSLSLVACAFGGGGGGGAAPRAPKPTPLLDKLLVIMGPTGAGKSRLSLDLAGCLPPGTFEVINSDKMQLYKGLDVTTNKLTPYERRIVPHHLIGVYNALHGEVTPSDFRRVAGEVVTDTTSRGKLPVLVGGSNSFIHALVVDHYEPDVKVFDNEEPVEAVPELRYDCCFLWVDVSPTVLDEYLAKRVEKLLDSGMFYELAEFHDSAVRNGLRKAIGVPEFSFYFKKYPPKLLTSATSEVWLDLARRGEYDKAVKEIKVNTYKLAKRQVEKIARLRKLGWDIRRLDATEAFEAAVGSEEERCSEIWTREVVEPSVRVVKRFLEHEEWPVLSSMQLPESKP